MEMDGMAPWMTTKSEFQTGGELHFRDYFRECSARGSTSEEVWI